MPLGWYGSDPGAAFNDSKVKEALNIRIGDELLFPVYDAVKSNGANFEYRVIGWVGFVVTGFTSHGNKAIVDGHFVRVIWEGILSESGGRAQKTSEFAPSSSSNNNQERGRKETLMTYRVKNITIAVALALVAALLTSFYVTNYQRNVRQDETNVPIWVAKRDIPAGTSGADIERKGMFEKSEIVRRSVVPGAISNPDQVAELVTSQPIYAGEQVSTRRFSTPSQRGIKAQLTGVQRAIAIPGDEHQLLAGTLKAGDKVDVVATFGVGGANGPNVSRIVLRDIEVLRAPAGGGAETKITASSKDGAFAVMLRVTDTQVQKLAWVFTDRGALAPRAAPGDRRRGQPRERRVLVLGAARRRSPEAAQRRGRGSDPGRRWR